MIPGGRPPSQRGDAEASTKAGRSAPGEAAAGETRGGWSRVRTWARSASGAEPRALLGPLALLLMALGLWAFLEIADEVIEGDAREVDVAILRALRDPAQPDRLRGPPWVAEVARDITALGSATVLIGITGIAVGYLWLQGLRRAALLALVAVAGGTLLCSALKLGFARERPVEVVPLLHLNSHSFPSGHSTMAAIVYLSLAVVLAGREPRGAIRAYVLGIGAGVALLVGISRVVLGVHYPSDVFAGWSIGLAWAAGCWLLLPGLQRPRAARGASPCGPQSL